MGKSLHNLEQSILEDIRSAAADCLHKKCENDFKKFRETSLNTADFLTSLQVLLPTLGVNVKLSILESYNYWQVYNQLVFSFFCSFSYS